jgi:NADP-dependent 3-hydroxy acid dehydrogenase YdfG
MFKILCTGNPSDVGLPQSIQLLYPDAEFLSRTTGYNFLENTNDAELKFRQKLKEFNVFVNYSWIDHGVQQRLLQIVAEEWTRGHVINIGSINENCDVLKKTEPEYTDTKLKLRKTSIDLNNEHLKTTHIVVGAFWRADTIYKTMDPIYIANTIKWVLEQDFEIPIIGIQQSSDFVRNWIQQQGKKL